MKIGIIGAGAVGGYFGGFLSKAGNDVLFLDIGKHYDLLKQEGLRIENESEHFVIHETFSNSYKDLFDADYVLFCVKAMYTREIAQQLLPILKSNAMILTLQNGVNNEEILSEIFGKDRVISVATHIELSSDSNGIIKQYGSLPLLIIGALDAQSTSHVDSIVSLFEKAGVKAQSSDDIVNLKWQKLLWNVSFNPLSALTETKVAEILENEALLKIAKAMCLEAIRVAEKRDITFNQQIYDGIFLNSHVAGQHKTSMLQDKLNKRPMELDSICGDIINKGKYLQVDTPVIETIYNLLKFQEMSN